MRFMIMIKSNPQTESGAMPDEKILTAMGKFNEDMVKAGVLLAGEGLQPSSKGARVRFSGGKCTVVDGPFSEAKELIAGFWIIKVKSKAEAIEWASRIPGGTDDNVEHFGGDFEVEVRQVFDAEDFDYAPEVIARDAKLRAAIDEQKSS